MWARLISTIRCKMQSGLLSVSFLSSSLFPVFSISDTAMAVVILRTENGNKNFTSRQQNQMTPNMHAARSLFNTLQRYHAKLTAADSRGRASKCGNGVKKRGAGRASTSIDAGESQTFWEWAHVWAKDNQELLGEGQQWQGGLEILEVLFNSWPHLESFSNIWEEALNPYSQRWKIRGMTAWHFHKYPCIFSGKISGDQQEFYLKIGTSETFALPAWLNVQKKSVSQQKVDWRSFRKLAHSYPSVISHDLI